VDWTFGWFNRFRRSSKDYELYSKTSEAMIYSIVLNVMLLNFCEYIS
jgi:putative transposase